jgi:membrane fusion protein, copper/silver efflux system
MKKPVTISSLLLFGLLAFAVGRHSSSPTAEAQAVGTKRVLYYVDPMHPAYRSDKPGIAPDCGMALAPVYEGDDPASKLQLQPGTVYLDTEKQMLIGVHVQTVEKNSGTRLIRTTGRVEANKTRMHRVMAGAEGWVESVENNTEGTLVKKDEVLATIYSRDFRNAEQAYLGSIASVDRLRSSHDPEDTMRPSSDPNIRINEEQLRALGMGEPQIKELAKTRQITRNITLNSPIDGVVLSRSVSSGQRFEPGEEFYRIADLTSVWITADIFSDDAPLLRPGARVRVNVRERAKMVYATVSQDPPIFDPASRTLKLRLEAQNPDLLLRPDMFVDLEFSTPAPPGVSIPQEAILDSGMQKVVYVESSEGVFEPRRVTVGIAYGDFVTVTSGLTLGERIVVSGNFLIDSESRMRSSRRASSSKAPQAAYGGMSRLDPAVGVPLDPYQAQAAEPTKQNPARSADAGVEVGNLEQVLRAHRGAHA